MLVCFYQLARMLASLLPGSYSSMEIYHNLIITVALLRHALLLRTKAPIEPLAYPLRQSKCLSYAGKLMTGGKRSWCVEKLHLTIMKNGN